MIHVSTSRSQSGVCEVCGMLFLYNNSHKIMDKHLVTVLVNQQFRSSIKASLVTNVMWYGEWQGLGIGKVWVG